MNISPLEKLGSFQDRNTGDAQSDEKEDEYMTINREKFQYNKTMLSS